MSYACATEVVPVQHSFTIGISLVEKPVDLPIEAVPTCPAECRPPDRRSLFFNGELVHIANANICLKKIGLSVWCPPARAWLSALAVFPTGMKIYVCGQNLYITYPSTTTFPRAEVGQASVQGPMDQNFAQGHSACDCCRSSQLLTCVRKYYPSPAGRFSLYLYFPQCPMLCCSRPR